MSDMLDRKLFIDRLNSAWLQSMIWPKEDSDPSGKEVFEKMIALLEWEVESSALSPQDNTRQQEGLLSPDEARKVLIGMFKTEYHYYIENYLAGDFAAELVLLLNANTPSPPTKQEPPHDHT